MFIDSCALVFCLFGIPSDLFIFCFAVVCVMLWFVNVFIFNVVLPFVMFLLCLVLSMGFSVLVVSVVCFFIFGHLSFCACTLVVVSFFVSVICDILPLLSVVFIVDLFTCFVLVAMCLFSVFD